MTEQWTKGAFRIRLVGRKTEWREGWMRGAFGIHSYRTISEHGFEPAEVDVYALTHLPSGYRMAAAFTLEDTMQMFELINPLEDWFALHSRREARKEPRWQAVYHQIGSVLRGAGYGYALDHEESRVLVRIGSTWPPEQQVAQH